MKNRVCLIKGPSQFLFRVGLFLVFTTTQREAAIAIQACRGLRGTANAKSIAEEQLNFSNDHLLQPKSAPPK